VRTPARRAGPSGRVHEASRRHEVSTTTHPRSVAYTPARPLIPGLRRALWSTKTQLAEEARMRDRVWPPKRMRFRSSRVVSSSRSLLLIRARTLPRPPAVRAARPGFGFGDATGRAAGPRFVTGRRYRGASHGGCRASSSSASSRARVRERGVADPRRPAWPARLDGWEGDTSPRRLPHATAPPQARPRRVGWQFPHLAIDVYRPAPLRWTAPLPARPRISRQKPAPADYLILSGVPLRRVRRSAGVSSPRRTSLKFR
jgi:hypothetical protein